MGEDTFDKMQPRERGRFGDNEMAAARPKVGKKPYLADIDVVLHLDKKGKGAIAVSQSAATPFEGWVWLPRSLIEYEAVPSKADGAPRVLVTMPRRTAIQKGLLRDE